MANYDLTYEGSRVQSILDTGDELRDAGYIFCGEATPSTVPGTPTERVAYIGGPGTYTNFGGSITVDAGCVCIFKYTGSAWSNQVINTGLDSAVTTLQNAINTINNNIGNGYVYAGVATPSTSPVTGKVFYLAVQAGTYTNFGNAVVTAGLNVIKYNGSAWSVDQAIAIDAEPTQGSDHLVKSGGVLNSIIQNGPAFDLSAYNAQGGVLATYADLSAALTALNALPADFKKGGMSFKFVQSSDNNYIQARCMAQNFTTDVTKWESGNLDEEPTLGSNNAVKSGGVEKKYYELLENCKDENGKEYGLVLIDKERNIGFAIDGSGKVYSFSLCFNTYNGNSYIIDANGNIAFRIAHNGMCSFLISKESFVKAFNDYKQYIDLEQEKTDYNYIFPSIIFDIESGSSRGREFLTAIYPEGLTKDNVALQIGGSRRKIVKEHKAPNATIATALIEKIYSYKIGGTGLVSHDCSTKVIRVNRKSAQNKQMRVLCIGDSITQANYPYPDGTYKGGWGYPSLMKELSIKDNVDIGNISVLMVGTTNKANNNNRPFSYKGNNYTVRSFSEGYSGYTAYGFANYPVYVRIESSQTYMEAGQKFLEYKAMYYLCGLATKTPNFSGSSPAQVWTDVPSQPPISSALADEICGTPVGKYMPNPCKQLWDAFKVFDPETFTGDYDTSVSNHGDTAKNAIIEDWLLNPSTGKLYNPDNKFYSYEKASQWVNGSYNVDVAFSLSKYIERYRTMDDEGNRLYFDANQTTTGTAGASNVAYLANGNVATDAQGNTLYLGSKVDDTERYDVCMPTNAILNIGVNDAWLSNASIFDIIKKILLAIVADNANIYAGWTIKRVNGALNPDSWEDIGLFSNLYNNYPQKGYELTKLMMENYPNYSGHIHFIPAYFTQIVSNGYDTNYCEDAIFENAEKSVSSSDSLHTDLYCYNSLAWEYLAWVYYTLNL